MTAVKDVLKETRIVDRIESDPVLLSLHPLVKMSKHLLENFDKFCNFFAHMSCIV